MFLYTHKNTDLSINYTNWISDDKLTLKIYISKQIRYFNSWRQVLSIDSASITSGMIESVNIENEYPGTVITIKLKSLARKLITDIVMNPNDNSDMQAFIPDWGYIQAPQATIRFDTTIYRNAVMPTEEAAVQLYGLSAAYYEIMKIRTKETEEVAVQLYGASISYEHIDQLRYQRHVEESTVGLYGATMNYEMVASSPI